MLSIQSYTKSSLIISCWPVFEVEEQFYIVLAKERKGDWKWRLRCHEQLTTNEINAWLHKAEALNHSLMKAHVCHSHSNIFTFYLVDANRCSVNAVTVALFFDTSFSNIIKLLGFNLTLHMKCTTSKSSQQRHFWHHSAKFPWPCSTCAWYLYINRPPSSLITSTRQLYTPHKT